MQATELDRWLDSVLPKHGLLTSAVITIVENLLRSKNIDYLAVTGRTKDRENCVSKIKRKGYESPSTQLTDLSGIRIILYFESDVKKVSDIIREVFLVDEENSLDKDSLLSTNQIGYRSVHYVCDLGEQRSALPEFEGLSELKFEFQVRTVLQHAWAELAHDRNYKFSGKLPKEIERQLFLYAGMLEIADKGFDELSVKIDDYMKMVAEKASVGDFSTEINSLSLEQFVEKWCEDNNLLFEPLDKGDYGIIVEELREFGVTTLAELRGIIPAKYASACKKYNEENTLYGYVRDWMLISNWRKYLNEVEFSWTSLGNARLFEYIFDEEELLPFLSAFGTTVHLGGSR